MIRKILIANRGEIACRITRTCHAMGISVVAVYSDADANALFVEMADEAVHIGGSPAAESYLNGAKITAAAKRTGADAIHPGFGFLAENAAFAQSVIDAGLIFIGPRPDAIEAMGKKRESKRLLQGVPLVSGYEGDDQRDAALLKAADQIGYPVMVKASAGGGGKGMRRVESARDMPDALASARREAQQAFGDDTLILEKSIVSPRHIEIQVFGDQHGSVIALGERECSIQRRHQKIIEETPSTALDDNLRQQISEVAVSIGRQLNYSSAGTVEFLLDQDQNFYFMEMNTRLQVEHPVTEMVYGVDLVRWQILAAEGQPLDEITSSRLSQVRADPRVSPGQPTGHSIEVRVYAEDPANQFLPVTGTVLHWQQPNELTGLRIDSGVRSGDVISPHYDPMIAKLIAWGETRQDAIRRLDYALLRLKLLGLRNNVAFLRQVLNHPDFIAGHTHTNFIDQRPDLLVDDLPLSPTALVAAAVKRTQGEQTHEFGFWRNHLVRPMKQMFIYRDSTYGVDLLPQGAGRFSADVDDQHLDVRVLSQIGDEIALVVDGHRQTVTVVASGSAYWVHILGSSYRLEWIDPLPVPGRAVAAEGSLRAPMPGQIISIPIEVGEHVVKDAILMTLEAMKMEHRILSPYDGIVGAIHFKVGDSVQADTILLEVHPQDS